MQDTGDSYDTQLQSICRVAVSKKSKNERQLGSFFIWAGESGPVKGPHERHGLQKPHFDGQEEEGPLGF